MVILDLLSVVSELFEHFSTNLGEAGLATVLSYGPLSGDYRTRTVSELFEHFSTNLGEAGPAAVLSSGRPSGDYRTTTPGANLPSTYPGIAPQRSRTAKLPLTK